MRLTTDKVLINLGRMFALEVSVWVPEGVSHKCSGGPRQRLFGRRPVLILR